MYGAPEGFSLFWRKIIDLNPNELDFDTAIKIMNYIDF